MSASAPLIGEKFDLWSTCYITGVEAELPQADIDVCLFWHFISSPLFPLPAFLRPGRDLLEWHHSEHDLIWRSERFLIHFWIIHQDFSWAPIRQPYKQLQPAQMVLHRVGYCGGSVLRRVQMLKNYIKSTSVLVESKNKSLVEGVPPRKDYLCAEKGPRKTSYGFQSSSPSKPEARNILPAQYVWWCTLWVWLLWLTRKTAGRDAGRCRGVYIYTYSEIFHLSPGCVGCWKTWRESRWWRSCSPRRGKLKAVRVKRQRCKQMGCRHAPSRDNSTPKR